MSAKILESALTTLYLRGQSRACLRAPPR